jgi:hypothetical protein
MLTPRFVALACLCLIVEACAAAWAQDVQPYPNALTDREVHPKTAMTPPSVNTVFRDPDFGTLMVRVTDSNTNPNNLRSYFRNPESMKNAWSADGRKFFLVGEGNIPFGFGFNPSTMLISALPGAATGGAFHIPLHAGPTFSAIDPDLMYGTLPQASLTIASFRFSTGMVTPLFDTTTCATHPALVAGARVTSSDLSISADENRIEINAGGSQPGNRTLAIVYDKKLGCRWYNTQTGQIGGSWGPTGKALVPQNFLINHAQISGNGQYVRLHAGPIGWYVWDVRSLNVRPCFSHGGLLCNGYAALGYDTVINSANALDEMDTFRRPLSDLTKTARLVNPLPLPHLWGMEILFTWTGGRLNNNVPVCGSAYSRVGLNEVKQPYDGEIFCMETDLQASTIWRFAHHRGIWDSEYYWSQPFENLSLDGRFLLFSSNWDLQLGTTKNGDPRSDVWIVKLD